MYSKGWINSNSLLGGLMKLSLEIPLPHWDDFVDEVDFHYALADYVLNDQNYRDKYKIEGSYMIPQEIWLDNSWNELREDIGIDKLLKAMDYIHPTHVTALESDDPQENIKNVIKTKTEFQKRGLNQKVVSCFRGGKREMELLLEVSDIVALPYDDYREGVLKLFDSSQFHYFGFKNLDELRRHKPRSLDTSVPIRAAYIGIDLSTRERRPKNLPLFDPYLKMTKEQVKLALKNIKSIKEAGNDE